MPTIVVLGATLPGLAAASRLARVGHTVTILDADPHASLADVSHDFDRAPIAFPAPWRDFFAKTGRPLKGTLGAHQLELVEDDGPWPGDRGRQWHHLTATLGVQAATAWRDLVDHYDDVWLALRPLGLEEELTPDKAKRAASIVEPARSLHEVAAALPHAALQNRVLALAGDHDPSDMPGWLASRLSVERTFGLWRLLDAHGALVRNSVLLDLVGERAVAVGVQFTDDPPPADATIDARDPGMHWHRPRRALLRKPTFLDQLLARPSLRDPEHPGHFHASPSSPGGREPWAQLLTGALVAYAVHEHVTGEDIRPTNKSNVRHPGR